MWTMRLNNPRETSFNNRTLRQRNVNGGAHNDQGHPTNKMAKGHPLTTRAPILQQAKANAPMQYIIQATPATFSQPPTTFSQLIETNKPRNARLVEGCCSGQSLTLVTKVILAGCRSVVFFVVAREQVSQTLVDVFHISPHGFCDLGHF